MRVLLPFLALYRRHSFLILLGIVLAIVTLLASIGLLTLSGWFLAGSALAGLLALTTFNYMLPAAGVRGAAIFRTAGRYAERLVSHDATFRVLAHLRVFTFERIFPLSPGGMAQYRQADLLNRLVADVDTLDHLYLRVISPLVSAAIVIIVICCGLSFFNPTLALTLGAILTVLLVLFPVVFYRLGHPIGEALTHLRGQYRIQLMSSLQGHAELVIFGALARFRKRHEETETQWQEQQQKQARLTALAQGLMTLATGLTVVLILWLAAGIIRPEGLQAAMIGLWVFVSLASFEALMPVAGAFQHLGHVIASATRIHQIIQTPPAVVFPTVSETSHTVPSQVSITLEDVSFTYPQQPLPVLKKVSLHINAGEHIALLGSTGCGKSTLLQLLTRAWDVTEGEICFNNRSIKSYDETTLRNMMVVVSQRVHIFGATLRQNLLLAAPEASDEQLVEVLQQVGLNELLRDDGLNAWLGEGGRQLSGGEQRRLSIARALLHPAPLLLLDEPTEGLDAETEQHILTLLFQHAATKTVITISHRLARLEYMDRIYVMDAGELLEQGTHYELLKQQGRYFQFHQRRKHGLSHKELQTKN